MLGGDTQISRLKELEILQLCSKPNIYPVVQDRQ